jgi:hypothetical protein
VGEGLGVSVGTAVSVRVGSEVLVLVTLGAGCTVEQASETETMANRKNEKKN